MKLLRRLLWIAAIVPVCVGCDQGTKMLAEEHLAGIPRISWLGGMVRLQYSENPGILLGIGSRLPEAVRSGVFIIVAMILGLVLLWVIRDENLGLHQVAALSLVLGGGVSNLMDRLFNDGAVIDFMNIGVGRLRTGIFNVADVAVFGGIALFLLHYPRRPTTPGEAGSEDRSVQQVQND